MSGGYILASRAVYRGECDTLIRAAKGAERIVMPHRSHPEFLVAMQACAVLARQWLGPNVSGLGSDYFGVSAASATHCDNDFVGAAPGAFMSVWLALADVTLDNGPLVINGQPIPCAKGDAILIDGDTPHRSCAGRGPRPVALFTYIKTGSPFRPGNTQQRAEVPL